jgi:Ca2+:H+ antiporter
MWRLIAGWATVGVFALFGGDLLAKSVLDKWPLEALLFVWILGVILWCAFGVVTEADHLAEMLGDPY